MAVITNTLLEQVVALLDSETEYIGIGTGVPPQQTDLLLDSEQIRKLASGYLDGTTLIKEIFLSEGEANGVQFLNTGMFDNTATSSINTGNLLVGSDIDLLKNNTENATISFEITVKRGG